MNNHNLVPFTSATAKVYAAKSIEARRRAKLGLDPKTGLPLVQREENAELNETKRQIQLIDERFRTAPMKLWPTLADAKAKLWKLVFPTQGVTKPARSKRDQSTVQPLS